MKTVTMQCGGRQVALQPISETILRVCVNLKGAPGIPDIRSKAVCTENFQEPAYTVSQSGDRIVLKTSSLWAVVDSQGEVDFLQPDGTPLCTAYRQKRRRIQMTDFERQAMGSQFGAFFAGDDPTAVSIPIVLNGDEVFLGLGDKAGCMNKAHYAYEMWNTDDGSVHTEMMERLYKSMPFFLVITQGKCFGIFVDHTGRSRFDFGVESQDYFYFETTNGTADFYFFAGNSVRRIVQDFYRLTGTAPLLPKWALGLHQSKFNYWTEDEVLETARRYRQEQIPCDVLYLDIGYMDGFRVFTWDKQNFPHPERMLAQLREMGFKTVAIVDPGVKVECGYPVYQEGHQNGYFLTAPDGSEYHNQVWPGEIAYPDFGRPEVQTWWGRMVQDFMRVGIDGIWNDMNEPAGFQPFPEDVVFSDGDTKSDNAHLHNVYGHFMTKGTYEAIRAAGSRPFVITRACYAGTQRYGVTWTGDNRAIWAHLKLAVPQMLSMSISGMAISGADVGGYGGNVTPELLIRWVQFASFSPFFRIHSAAFGQLPHEPWAWKEPVPSICRKYIQLRYRLIPYYYDILFENESNGLGLVRPLSFLDWEDPKACQCGDEFLLGDDLLVAPVLDQGADCRPVYLPRGQWFDFWTGEKLQGGQTILRDAPLDTCPIYVRSGSILPLASPMQYVGETGDDEMRLAVYPGEGQHSHYEDNGIDFDYRTGGYDRYDISMTADGHLRVTRQHYGFGKVFRTLTIQCLGRSVSVPFDNGNAELNLFKVMEQ